MVQQANWWIGIAATLALSGCGTLGGGAGGGAGDAAVEDRTGATTGGIGGAGGAGAQAIAAQDYGRLGVEALQDPSSLLAQRVVYFALDSTDIAAGDRDLLAAHASFLAGHEELVVRLEGHTDERGSREYNVGLGDRRAQAVRRLLEFQGVSPDQIRTVSYGEERSSAIGHEESAWRLNRRVELVYGGQ